MTEIWKDIKGYEGYYQVSNLGNVKALNRYVLKGDKYQYREGKNKKQWKNPDGYLICKLSKDNKDWNIPVHVLVAKAFLGNKDYKDGWEVDHLDSDRTNNCVDNLEWVTHKENIERAAEKGHMKHYGKDNPNYGNNTLKRKFKEHPELRALQSRKGKQNGRALPVKVINSKTGEIINFDYIREAAQYFIDNNITLKNNVPKLDSLATKLKECIVKNKKYCEYEIKFA